MDTKNHLRNSLVRKIQRLSADKLTEINNVLNNMENQFKSKDKTLKFAGVWKDLDLDFFSETIDQLHTNRTKDRHIN
jgi:hypothetical protein